MAVFTGSVYAKNTTDLLGIGVTLNADGSVATVTGPTIRYVTVAPTQADNAGSIALRSNGTVYVTTGGGVWVAIGGASGGNYPNDVAATWGTTSPLQGSITYVSASNRWDLVTGAVSQATAQASASVRLATGATTITGAVVGNGSGSIDIFTGATDSTNAGGTAGVTGGVNIRSGASTSTLGTSGNTGPVGLVSGNSDDNTSGDASVATGTGVNTGSVVIASGASNGAGVTGNVILRTGTTGGVRGAVSFESTNVGFTAQATTFNLINNNAAALTISSSGFPGILTFVTTTGAVRVTFGAATLGNIPQALVASANQTPGVPLLLPVTFAAGASTTDFALPARTGGWRIFDAFILSAGATGGTVQVQTAGGAANVTPTMVPGNAGIITRTTGIEAANATFAGGATVRINVAAGAPAGEAFLSVLPL